MSVRHEKKADAVTSEAAERLHILCIGGEDHALRMPFLAALRDLGFRVSAAANADPAPFARAEIEYHQLALARFIDLRTDLRALKAIGAVISRLRPSIVQCFDTKLNILVPLAARRVGGNRVVSTINGLGWLYSSRSPLAIGLRPVYCNLQRWAARWTDVMVFQNRDDQRFFELKRISQPRTRRLVPGSGIDIARFDGEATKGPSVESLRKEFGLGAAPIVMTVSRMTHVKGIPTLLAAAKLLHHERPDVRFLLVGPRENEGRLAVSTREIEEHAPYVRALGARSDIPNLLRLADVFVCPTELREGVPRVLLEASAAGLPIVATAVPGCTDVIQDGWSGYLVPTQSPEALAERILALLQNTSSAKIFGQRASKHVRKEFSLDVTIARYASIYRALAEPSDGSPIARAGSGVGWAGDRA